MNEQMDLRRARATRQCIEEGCLAKVDAAVSMIKTRVSFVALGEQQPSVDERDSKNERLWDFELPIEYLPALLR